jgi:head-tail adaptor
MDAGRRDKRIRIEYRTVAADGYGGETETWNEIARPWADVIYGAGVEQRQAAQQSASQIASFEFPRDSRTRSINPIDHRIVFDGGIWNITAKNDLSGNEGIRVTAVRGAA